jgi:hypothetical protein
MPGDCKGRRAFLRKVTALGAAGFALPAAGARRRAKYSPDGGGWNYKDRYANEPMDRAIASSGVLVVAIDMTLAGEAPYPASVQDAHYGMRWLKWKAPQWNGEPSSVGVFGSSTGGHIGQLIAMRPRDARYAAHALPEAPHLDAGVAYFASRSPISDPYARYLQAEKMKRERMINFTKTWFVPWETIFEANPQYILGRREPWCCDRSSSCRAPWTTTYPGGAGEVCGFIPRRRRHVPTRNLRGLRA